MAGVTAREAKRYVCRVTAHLLEDGLGQGVEWLSHDVGDETLADGDLLRVKAAALELADELRKRGGA